MPVESCIMIRLVESMTSEHILLPHMHLTVISEPYRRPGSLACESCCRPWPDWSYR